MEDRALMYALGEIISTVDKMRGTHTLNHLFTLRDIIITLIVMVVSSQG